MNLYLRYFDNETLVATVDEAMEFLMRQNLDGFTLDDAFRAELTDFQNNNINHPLRCKVRGHIYFLVIRTTATSLEDFHANKRKLHTAELTQDSLIEPYEDYMPSPENLRLTLNDEVYGWYDGALNFKRIITNSATGKKQYVDARFRALCKAESPLDCYNRIVSHLKSRPDIDPRSQFPSAKGRNFEFSYLGTETPECLLVEEEEEVE